MKVVINESVEVTEEQRMQLRSVIDGKVSRGRATRNEFKEFIRVEGIDNWPIALSDAYRELTGEQAEDDEEDLLGDTDSALGDLL